MTYKEGQAVLTDVEVVLLNKDNIKRRDKEVQDALLHISTDEIAARVIGLWSVAAVGGPVLGPVIGGFVAETKGWTWTIWILLWLSGLACAFLLFLLPETSAHA